MRERVGIDFHAFGEDRRGAARHLAHGDVQQEHRGLEHVETNELLDEVAAGHDDIEPGKHQEYGDPVIVETRPVHPYHSRSSSPPARAANR